MLPRMHILLGFLFSIFFWILFPHVYFWCILLIFAASFLIDIDHYLQYVFETKNFSLKNAFKYHIMLGKIGFAEKKRGIRKKGPFHVFHTFEFLLVVYLLSFAWMPLLYVFVGMIFHSFLDIIYLTSRGFIYRREFFLINWVRKRYN
jgi:hypothetical protein